MNIKLFLVNRIDCSAVKRLASIIYSNAIMHQFVTEIKIDEHGAEFIRPFFYKNIRVPFSPEGLECHDGILYNLVPSGGRLDAGWLSAAHAGNSDKYRSIMNAVRRLSSGYLTEVAI